MSVEKNMEIRHQVRSWYHSGGLSTTCGWFTNIYRKKMDEVPTCHHWDCFFKSLLWSYDLPTNFFSVNIFPATKTSLEKYNSGIIAFSTFQILIDNHQINTHLTGLIHKEKWQVCSHSEIHRTFCVLSDVSRIYYLVKINVQSLINTSNYLNIILEKHNMIDLSEHLLEPEQVSFLNIINYKVYKVLLVEKKQIHVGTILTLRNDMHSSESAWI